MNLLRKLFGRLRLKVNESKSAVAHIHKRQFLGFSFWTARGGDIRRRVSTKAKRAFMRRIRQLTRRTRGKSLEQVVQDLREYILGWRSYYDVTQARSRLPAWDRWIRHRLRAYQLRQWGNAYRVYDAVRALGLGHRHAAELSAHHRSYWRASMHQLNGALTNRYFAELGLPSVMR